MTISAIFSAFFANIITQYVKPAKQNMYTKEQLQARRLIVRFINAVIGITIMLLGTIWFGEPLAMDTLTANLEIVAGGVLTFFSSQTIYSWFQKS